MQGREGGKKERFARRRMICARGAMSHEQIRFAEIRRHFAGFFTAKKVEAAAMLHHPARPVIEMGR